MMDRRKDPPTWFFDRPELFPGQEAYLKAFDQLTTCRFVSQGSVGRIPWTAMYQYAEYQEMDPEEFRLFEHVIEKLDAHYVNWVYDQMKSERDSDA